MVEVFRTDVTAEALASLLVNKLEERFPGYKVNFDLDDCDHILRIRSFAGDVHAAEVIRFLQNFGCNAEVLPDEEPVSRLLFSAGETLMPDPPRSVSRWCGSFSRLGQPFDN